MTPTGSQLHSWEAYSEDVFSLGDTSTFEAVGLLEQINITRDNSDYLWYITSVDISPSESFLRGGQKPTLNVHSNGHAVHVSVNGKPSGTSYGIQKDTKFNSTGGNQ